MKISNLLVRNRIKAFSIRKEFCNSNQVFDFSNNNLAQVKVSNIVKSHHLLKSAHAC
jgi:hypothetical protein